MSTKPSITNETLLVADAAQHLAAALDGLARVLANHAPAKPAERPRSAQAGGNSLVLAHPWYALLADTAWVLLELRNPPVSLSDALRTINEARGDAAIMSARALRQCMSKTLAYQRKRGKSYPIISEDRCCRAILALASKYPLAYSLLRDYPLRVIAASQKERPAERGQQGATAQNTPE